MWRSPGGALFIANVSRGARPKTQRPPRAGPASTHRSDQHQRDWSRQRKHVAQPAPASRPSFQTAAHLARNAHVGCHAPTVHIWVTAGGVAKRGLPDFALPLTIARQHLGHPLAVILAPKSGCNRRRAARCQGCRRPREADSSGTCGGCGLF